MTEPLEKQLTLERAFQNLRSLISNVRLLEQEHNLLVQSLEMLYRAATQEIEDGEGIEPDAQGTL